MKKYIFYIALSFLITTSLSARKTGCEGNCENGLGTMDAIEFINSKLKETKSNADFFSSMNKPI